MNDEIKEIKKLIAIINCMKDSKLLDNGEYYKVHSDFIISLEENKTQLLNYITNLQKENERLKEKIEHLLIDLNGESEYKIRNDKAIEYIKNIDNYLEIGGDMLGNNYIKVDSGFIFKLEDILKGE